MKIYLAGPLFTSAEQEFNRHLRDALLDFGHEVWLPQEHEPRKGTAKAIFEEDVKGLELADVVVANMDGPDPDSGTCWECGYAFRKKPIVLFRTDFRQAGDAPGTPFNLMMSESAAAIILARLASARQVAAKINEELRRIRTAQTKP
jgi:nucleoside 2-deoxyribosyltransferase